MENGTDQLIFDSDQVRIRYCPGNSDDLLVITFANFLLSQSKSLPGFGEKLLRAEGISAIHVTCSSNRWFQHGELLRLGELVAGIRGRYRQVVTYGSSMGAYAAILFSGQVRADRVVAASPQYSIDPAKVPYDRTWDWVAKDVEFINDEISLHTSGQVFLIYDDKHVDGRHADSIAAEMPVQRIVTPYSGHPAVHFLHRAGILKGLVLDLIHGRYDEARVRSLIREVRKLSAGHLCSLARRGRSIERRLRLLEQAQVVEPQRVEIYAVRGQIHNGTGNLLAAAQAFRDALAANPRHNWAKTWLADVLSRTGQHSEAVALTTDAVAASPATAEFHYSLGRCLTRYTGRSKAALAAFEEAVRLDPCNLRYKRSLHDLLKPHG